MRFYTVLASGAAALEAGAMVQAAAQDWDGDFDHDELSHPGQIFKGLLDDVIEGLDPQDLMDWQKAAQQWSMEANRIAAMEIAHGNHLLDDILAKWETGDCNPDSMVKPIITGYLAAYKKGFEKGLDFVKQFPSIAENSEIPLAARVLKLGKAYAEIIQQSETEMLRALMTVVKPAIEHYAQFLGEHGCFADLTPENVPALIAAVVNRYHGEFRRGFEEQVRQLGEHYKEMALSDPSMQEMQDAIKQMTEDGSNQRFAEAYLALVKEVQQAVMMKIAAVRAAAMELWGEAQSEFKRLEGALLSDEEIKRAVAQLQGLAMQQQQISKAVEEELKEQGMEVLQFWEQHKHEIEAGINTPEVRETLKHAIKGTAEATIEFVNEALTELQHREIPYDAAKELYLKGKEEMIAVWAQIREAVAVMISDAAFQTLAQHIAATVREIQQQGAELVQNEERMKALMAETLRAKLPEIQADVMQSVQNLTPAIIKVAHAIGLDKIRDGASIAEVVQAVKDELRKLGIQVMTPSEVDARRLAATQDVPALMALPEVPVSCFALLDATHQKAHALGAECGSCSDAARRSCNEALDMLLGAAEQCADGRTLATAEDIFEKAQEEPLGKEAAVARALQTMEQTMALRRNLASACAMEADASAPAQPHEEQGAGAGAVIGGVAALLVAGAAAALVQKRRQAPAARDAEVELVARA